MPLYEYICKACGNQFEKICSSSMKDSDVICPVCGKQHAKKKLSTFSFGSRNSAGEFKPAPSGGSSCASCSSHSCSTCGH